MQSSLYTRVHSRILDRGRICIRLWYVLRALDRDGSGWAEFTISELAERLKVAVPTLKRYIRQGLSHGIFRAKYKLGKGRVRLWYASVFEVATLLHLSDLGAVAEVDVESLSRSYNGALATQLDAERSQKGSYYLAKQQTAKSQQRRIINPSQVLAPRCKRQRKTKRKQSSHSSRGGIIFFGSRCLFVNEDAITTGVSQKHLSAISSRSISTIQRRLSNCHRVRRNLPTVLKRQLVRKETSAIGYVLKQIGGPIVDENGRCYFSSFGSAWRSGCNIYRPEFELRSVRYTRAKFKHKIATGKASLRASLSTSKDQLKDKEGDRERM